MKTRLIAFIPEKMPHPQVQTTRVGLSTVHSSTKGSSSRWSSQHSHRSAPSESGRHTAGAEGRPSPSHSAHGLLERRAQGLQDRNFLPSAIRDALSERLALKNTETARAGWHWATAHHWLCIIPVQMSRCKRQVTILKTVLTLQTPENHREPLLRGMDLLHTVSSGKTFHGAQHTGSTGKPG